MKMRNIKATLLMLLAVLSAGSACATVIFSDNFEAQALGAQLGTSGHTAVPTGLQWYQGGAPAGAFVTNAPALGTQSLALSRLSGGSAALFAISTSGAVGPGKALKFSWDMYGGGYDSAQIYLNEGGLPTMGGLTINWQGKYTVLSNGVAVASSLTPSGTGWDHVELDVTMTDAGGGLTGGTYDVWVTPSGGSATQIALAYPLVPKALPDTLARLLFQEGFGYENFIDNVKIETQVPLVYATNTIQFVQVGDPGNPGDARTGGTSGSVAYAYEISKYPIRCDQYAEFLNLVAGANFDPYHLASGHDAPRVGLTRTQPGNYFLFGVKPNYENKPINDLVFDSACRFCNWLHNGANSRSDTEDGAYDMSLSPNQVRKSGAKYFLPTHNEWYKAAFYQPGVVTPGGNANYWLYATRSDTLPGGAIANSVGNATNVPNINVANWADPTTPLGAFVWDGLNYNISTVGSCSNSASHYGAYDMNGNVYQWLETSNPAGTKRSYAGGSMNSGDTELPATLNYGAPNSGPPCAWWDYPDTAQSPGLGFRVARIAPPTISYSVLGNQLTLSWSGSGFKLQQNTSVNNAAGWTDVSGGGSSPATVTIGSGNLFFRLSN